MLEPPNSNSDQPIVAIFAYDTRELYCQGMRKIHSDDQKLNYDKTRFSFQFGPKTTKWAPGH